MDLYEKKYKEAVARMKRYVKDEYGCTRLRPEAIFPELKESEDERIRKELIKETKGSEVRLFETVTNEEFIAWIEKQGEHANFRNKIQIGDKVTRNEDGVLVNLSQLNRVAKKQGEQKDILEDAILDSNEDGLIAETIGVKQSEQKPAWSEEDKVKINRIVACLENLNVADNDILLKDVEWLKSLKDRVQPKQECSEEDERIVTELIGIFESAVDGGHVTFPYRLVKDYIRVLKLCLPQSQWKPSEGQMKAVNIAINVLGKYTLDGKELIELQEQLKKLKDE